MHSTKNQKARIHILKNALGFDDRTYRDILWFAFQKSSSIDLTTKEAAEIILVFEDWAREQGIKDVILSGAKNLKKKFDHLGQRPGMATPRQLRMIDAMWKGVSRGDTPEGKEKALRAFLENRFHISDLRFVEDHHVPKILEALNAMRKKQNQPPSLSPPLQGGGQEEAKT